MADSATLMTALRNAHNAGDTDAATRIAGMIKAQGGMGATDTPQQDSAPISNYEKPTLTNLAYGVTPIQLSQNVASTIMHPLPMVQKIDDMVRTGANAVTGGYADKFANYMNGLTGLNANSTLDSERAKSASAYDRLGVLGPATEIASVAIPGTALSKAGITASSIPRIGGLLGTSLDSAAYGAMNAGGHDANVGTGALEGLGLGALGHAIGTGATKAFQYLGGNSAMKSALENAPSFLENKAAKNAAYGQLQDAGIKFDADGFQQTLANISDGLKNFRAAKAPLTADTVDNLAQFNGTSPTFKDMEGMLQDAKSILREPNASNTDKAAAGVVVDHLNEFFNNGALSTNGSIPADQVASLAANARELARRDILAGQVGKMGDKAEWYKSGAESGLQNQVASFGKRAGASLTPAEYDAAQAVVKKEGLNNILNQAGTRIAMHGGSAAGTLLGGLFGGPVGAALGLGATTMGNLAARKISGNVTQNAFDNLQKTFLAGRTAQATARATDAQNMLAVAQRNALLGKLLGLGSVSANQQLLGN